MEQSGINNLSVRVQSLTIFDNTNFNCPCILVYLVILNKNLHLDIENNIIL